MKFVIFLALAFASAAPAELKWESTSKRFTYVRGKKVMEHEFAYTNAGNKAVRITEIKKGCACCTSVSMTRKTVEPGAAGVLNVRLNVAGQNLPVAKPVLVTTDDGKTTPIIIHVDTQDGKPVKVPKWGK